MSSQGYGSSDPRSVYVPIDPAHIGAAVHQQTNEILNSRGSADGKEGCNQPIHAERHMRVICIGAGASGLLLAYKLQRSFKSFTLTIYDKNAEVSGTWVENRYPGVACDVPAHNYTWSFEPNVDWTQVYASGSEIFRYFVDFKNKYTLGKYVKLSHQVVGAQWDDSNGVWNVEIQDLSTETLLCNQCDILINAAGILNNWRWPAIPGLQDFKGQLLHSASWDRNISLESKRVGLIGNGSTGIQILPAIQPIVSKLTTFIRSPTWIAPPFGMDQRTYTEQERKEFAEQSHILAQLRESNETNLNSMLGIYIKGSKLQQDIRKAFTEQMSTKLKSTDGLKERLIPQWDVGCRRLTPGVGYLDSLQKPNVSVCFGEITHIDPTGPTTSDGVTHPVDVLICATGFDTSFRPRFPLIGTEGKNLQDEWQSEAYSYLGLAVPKMPNYLMFLGPNCPIGNGPVLVAIEAEADYMLRLCDRWQTENIHSFMPTENAAKDFVQHTDAFMKGMVWEEDCRSWYKSNSAKGRVSALWPGSTLHYIEALEEPRFEDWDIKYRGNRFAWLGNGFSQTELDPDANLGYYIRSQDDSPYNSRYKRRQVRTYRGITYSRRGLKEDTSALLAQHEDIRTPGCSKDDSVISHPCS